MKLLILINFSSCFHVLRQIYRQILAVSTVGIPEGAGEAGLVDPAALVDVAIRHVHISFEHKILDILSDQTFSLEAPEGPLDVLEIHRDLPKNFTAVAAREVLGHLERVGNARVNGLAQNLPAAGLPRVLIPLVADAVEPLEVDGLAAHRATRAGTLQVPRLDAPVAELVPTRELLEGAGLGVAHRALTVVASHVSC